MVPRFHSSTAWYWFQCYEFQLLEQMERWNLEPNLWNFWNRGTIGTQKSTSS